MIGQILGHYRILDKLGQGGMGVVYRARDERLEREAALKVLLADALADETARARLLREARSAAALNHPNICTVYDVGEAEGQLYIAMEYVQGRTLSALVPMDGLPTETFIRYGSQIADALAHAHDRGIVHRDLKSSNVIITPEGRTKVLDFGLAKRMAARDLSDATWSDPGLTREGSVVGTLHYIAPEVLRGAAADARSDVWALGVLLHEMASGRLPFEGRTGFDLSSAILRDAPAPLPARVPTGVRAIIQACLAKEPGQRYQRAGEVRAALEAIQSGSAVAAPPPRPRPVRAPAAKPRAPRIRSLAVLPLANLSGDPSQEYLAEGMTESLLTDLAQIGALRVISRTSSGRYKGCKKMVAEIARELNVDAVVEGSILRSGNRVRMTAQLIHAATDRHLWARSYERDVGDLLAMQSEIARAVAAEIRVQLTPREQARLAAVRPVHRDAHEAYLKGIYLPWDPRFDPLRTEPRVTQLRTRIGLPQ